MLLKKSDFFMAGFIFIGIIFLAVVSQGLLPFSTVTYNNQCSVPSCPSGYTMDRIYCNDDTNTCTRECYRQLAGSCSSSYSSWSSSANGYELSGNCLNLAPGSYCYASNLNRLTLNSNYCYQFYSKTDISFTLSSGRAISSYVSNDWDSNTGSCSGSTPQSVSTDVEDFGRGDGDTASSFNSESKYTSCGTNPVSSANVVNTFFYRTSNWNEGSVDWKDMTCGYECNTEAECNPSGYIGDNFCKDSHVFRQYKMSNCQSYSCAYSYEDRLIQNCINGCSNGVCIELECTEGSEKCEGTTYYTCSANKWVSQGEVVEKCGVFCSENEIILTNNEYFICLDGTYKKVIDVISLTEEERLELLDMINNLNATIEEKLQIISDLTANLESQIYLINELELSISEKATIISGLELSLAEQTYLLESLNNSLQEKATIISDLELSIAEQTHMIQSLTETQAEQLTIINGLNLTISEQAEMINLLTSNLQEKASLISQLQAENEYQAQLIAQMGLSFADQWSIINSLNNTISDDASIIGDLGLNLEQQADLIVMLGFTNEEKAELIKEFNLELSEQADLIQAFRLQLSDDAEIIKNLNLSIDDMASMIKSFELTLEEEAKIIAHLNLKIEEEKTLVSKLRELIDDQLKLLNEVENQKKIIEKREGQSTKDYLINILPYLLLVFAFIILVFLIVRLRSNRK